MTLLIFSYVNSAHQLKAAAHHLSAPALLVAQPVTLKSKELRSKSPQAKGRTSKAPTLLWAVGYRHDTKACGPDLRDDEGPQPLRLGFNYI